MTDKLINSVAGVALIAISLVGLYFKVEYAGWVLFLGLVLVA